MKRNLALISLCLALSSSIHSQNPPDAAGQPLQLLRQAAHCLVTDSPDLHKLLRENRKELNLGYFLDTKSYPGEQALYVVDKPVGGVWTQEHMEDAIDRIGQDAMYLFSVKDARGPSADVTCESYSDAR